MFFGQENLQLLYIGTARFVIIVNTHDFIEDSKNFQELVDFSNLNENHELFRKENKKDIRNFKIGTPKKIWIDEFVCLRSKMSSFKCGDCSKIKIKGSSKSFSKNIKFNEYIECLDG